MRAFFRGFWLSVPAAGLIWAGLVDGTQPAGWYYFGAAALLGLPTNLMCLGASFPILATLGGPLEWNGWLVLAGSVMGSGVVGAHINGMLLGFVTGRRRKEVTAEASIHRHSRVRWVLWLVVAVVVAGLVYVTFRYS